ncbi:MAG: tetratricopeptide repeat protein [Isosphaeraceae bacterium]
MAAVNALRRYALAGRYSLDGFRVGWPTRLLRDRRDFRELVARADELARADTVARDANATPDEKLSAQRRVLAGLEALARPLPPDRSIRRVLAQARQDLGQALLGAGRADEAHAAFDQAQAERQALLAEAPGDDALRLDLMQDRFATGDLLADAGRMNEALAAWEGGLAALEAELADNPDRLPAQIALSGRLCEVGEHYLAMGLWPESLRCYRRAFAVREPDQFVSWHRYALMLAESGDTRDLAELIRKALDRRPNTSNVEDVISYDRLLVLTTSDDPRWPAALRAIVDNPRVLEWDFMDRYVRMLARIRLGQAKPALDLLAKIDDPLWTSAARAMAELRLGRVEAARTALRAADEAAEADHYLANATVPQVRGLPHWPEFRALRREVHRALGQEFPVSTTERMYRVRVLLSLGRDEPADSEFAAAVRPRPSDPRPWVTRARILAGLGRKHRASADLARAAELSGDDASTWIEIGRLIAELGDRKKADETFARASSLAHGALSPFLESGWWVVGPYPDSLDLVCAPEADPDPARPAAVLGGAHTLKWRDVAIDPLSGGFNLDRIAADRTDVSFYALAYVQADRDRTAIVTLGTERDARLWVNGNEAFAGFDAWGMRPGEEARIPVALCAGRNAILLKIRAAGEKTRCRCRFDDDPGLRAVALAEMGLWDRAADAFALADRRSRLAPDLLWYCACLHLLSDRTDQARRLFGELVRRHGETDSTGLPGELANCPSLPVDRTPDRDRWLAALRAAVDRAPGDASLHHRLAHACYLAGRYDEAERSIRRAIRLHDRPLFQPLLAAILMRTGKADEARRTLQETERRHAGLVWRALALPTDEPLPVFQAAARAGLTDWKAEVWYELTIREARRVVPGAEPGPTANELALRRRRESRQAEREGYDDLFARLAEENPGQPRYWFHLGRRRGEQKRWDEAMRAFDRAVKLAPGDLHLRVQCGRALAALGRWDRAAEHLAKALEWSPSQAQTFPDYPWMIGRGEADETIARSDELFRRMAPTRPKDRTLSARRAEALAEAGRWDEAEAALRGHIEHFPDDWWAPTLLAKSLLNRGKLDEYRKVCHEALDRFKSRTDYFLPINLARAALLGPSGC